MGRLRICILGDDLATSLGDVGGVGWMGQLSRLETSFGSRFEMMSLGVPCETTRALALRVEDELKPRLPQGAPALAVFCFGLADMAASEQSGVREPLPESLYWAETALRLSASHYHTLWIGPPPVRGRAAWRDAEGHVWSVNQGRMAGLNDAYRMQAELMGIPYLDLTATLERDKRWQRSLERGDGVHPTSEGHAALANHIGRWSAWRKYLNATTPGARVDGLHAPGPKSVMIA